MPAAAPASGLNFALVFAALPAPYALLLPNGQVQALNDALLALLPAGSAATCLGQSLAELVAGLATAGLVLPPAPAVGAALALALATGQPQVARPTLRPGAPPTAQYWQATLQAVPAQPASPQGLLLGLLDVTAHLRPDASLARARIQLQGLTEHLPQQVWTATADGKPDFFNERTAAFLGPRLSRWARRHWLLALHPADRAPVLLRWQQAVGQATFFEAEFRLRRRDGTYRWMLGQAQPEHDAAGQVLRWYGTNTDVHTQYMLTRQLVRREREFRFVAESIPHLVWTVEASGRLSFVNQRWVDYTGQTLGHTQQHGWAHLVEPAFRANAQHKLREKLAAGQEFIMRTPFLEAASGTYRWFLHHAQPLYNEAGSFVRWYGTSTDIDELARAQEQLEDQNQRLTRANQDFDNFVYAASHDLRQPITNMASIFEELTRTAYFRDPDAVKLIDYFDRALHQLSGTIDDLTTIVQVQYAQQAAPEPVALPPLADDIVHSVQDQVTRLRAQFSFDFTACPAVLYVRSHLQSVLYNLISNALKYAQPGRPPRIGLHCAPDAATGRPVLRVQDNGLGIDLARFGPQLFQQFIRFHAHVEGSGMGLYLVNRIVQSHGGHLSVASTVGEGTTFTVHL